MKHEKNKNIIITGLVINVILLIFLLLFSIVYLYPKISDIEDKKDNLAELVKKYNTIKKEGLPYVEFKKTKGGDVSFYQKKILSKIDKTFYENNFLNKKGKFINYYDFLNSLEDEINGELKEDYEKKHEKIFSVLPIYTESANDVNKGVMTDFKFINMIENLLYDYDLISESPLGIKDISKVESYSKQKNNSSDLSSDIYVIRLPLTIEGKKKNIVRFLQHIKELGIVKVCGKEDVEKGIDGCTYEKQLVIKNPQMFSEVDSVSMDKYIDSSPSISIDEKNKNLVDILTTTAQKNELFKIDVTLLFYVQGLPNYKIKQSINNIIGALPKGLKNDEKERLSRTNFGAIKSRLKTLQSKYRNNKLVSQQLNDIDGYLQSIEKDIKKINKEIPKAKDLRKIYNKVEKYKGIFSLISKKLDEIEKKASN